jgi:ketosteroid isomerase-like protein
MSENTLNLEEVEFANEAFYMAFEGKDFEAMAHIWSEQRQIICLHPGWPALIGRDTVLKSWKDILSNPAQGQVSFFASQVCQLTVDSAAVVCYEQAGGVTMVAINVFVREDERLRLVSHQAGYCAQPPDKQPHSV